MFPVIIKFTKQCSEKTRIFIIYMYVGCVCRKRMAPHSEDLSEYT